MHGFTGAFGTIVRHDVSFADAAMSVTLSRCAIAFAVAPNAFKSMLRRQCRQTGRRLDPAYPARSGCSEAHFDL
jgi:hypothetical protein